MIIKVLAFGIAKEIVGGAAISIEVSAGATINNLQLILKEKFPKLQNLSSLLVALNNEYAGGEDVLQTDDEIALIPPVCGG